jgi:3',5'-cyclic AMP phosphodiesterase CpdA
MWRFVQLTDLHLASTRDGVWNNQFLCTMMPEVMACIKKDLAVIEPDFILATGDIASTQTRAAMFEARDMMDALGRPYYPMGGNHDFVVSDSRKWFLEAFSAHLPTQDTVYSFTHEGLHFCVLDPWWQWADDSLSEISEASVAAKLETGLEGARWALPPDQFTWLENDLQAHDDLPTIIALHYPLMPIPERLRRPELQDGGCLTNGALLMKLLQSHCQVRAVFSGHVHLNFIEEVGGLTHVVTSALPEYPTEFREIEVYEDRLEVYSRGLSNPAFAERSLIPGKEWLAGEERDRRATISLT